MSLKLITAPDSYPVTLAEAKAHLRVDSSDDNSLISVLIKAAVDNIEGPKGFLGRALINQTWDYGLDIFPCVTYNAGVIKNYIEIPLPPLISITGIYYKDSGGVDQTLEESSYTVDTASEPGRVYRPNGVAWPSVYTGGNAVRIRFKAGYSDDVIPFSIKAAILIKIADLYENRESMVDGSYSELPWSAQQLLKPHRMHRGFA